MNRDRVTTIVQMLPILAYGDAVGNDVLALDRVFRAAGYQSEIYAEAIDQRIKGANIKAVARYREKPGQIILYHLSTGHELNRRVASFHIPLVVHYHNITPPVFFRGYNPVLERACREGLRDAAWLKDRAAFCIADSEYNRQDLIRMGYTCPIEVLPIMIPFDDYRKEPDQSVIDRWTERGMTNILFTGRVAPNKKQEDLIRCFCYYNRYLNPHSRLHIVGGYDSNDRYYQNLAKYVDELQLQESVFFTGHIPFDQILAYYRLADVFVCLSEHEGFCVPLVEAMFFEVPIIAYNVAAVGDTLGGGGILLDEKEPSVVAEAVHYLQEHAEIRDYLIERGKKQLLHYSDEATKKRLLSILEKYGI